MSVTGKLNISIDVWCPECDKRIDLMSIDSLRDDGWIFDLVLPSDKHWSGACKNFSESYLESFGEDFRCTHCKKIIYIEEIEW